MSLKPPVQTTAAPSSQDRALARGLFVVAAFAALAGLARVGQDALIAWRYGVGPLVDAFYFALNLVNWPVTVAMSTLTFLVTPADAVLRARSGAAGSVFRAELLGAVLCAAVISVPVAWWAMTTVTTSAIGGLEPETARLAAEGLPAILGAVPLGLAGALLAAWMVADGRHQLALLEALPPLVLIVVLLGVQAPSLYAGTTLGVALQVVAMALVLKTARALPAPKLGFSGDVWPTFANGAFALLLGQLLFALVPLVDPFFAARTGDGVVASMSFANRLVLGLQGLAGLALQRASLPLLSRWMVTSPDEARRAALRWAVVAAVGGAGMGLSVAWFAEPLVSLIYERGRFSAADREQVVMLLRYGMLQMPPFLAGLVLVSALVASGGLSALALAAATGLVAKLLLSALLLQSCGVAGLLIATSLMYVTTTLMVWLALNRRLQVGRR